MKKIFTFVLVFTLMFTFILPISATSKNEKLSDQEIQRIKSLSNESLGTSNDENENFFGNFFRLFSTIEAPKLVGHGKIECVDPWFGESYVKGISDSNIECDFISVKVKVYKDGTLYKQAEDSEEHATYVGASVSAAGSEYHIRETFAYGYHRFKKESYKDINLETYDKF